MRTIELNSDIDLYIYDDCAKLEWFCEHINHGSSYITKPQAIEIIKGFQEAFGLKGVGNE